VSNNSATLGVRIAVCQALCLAGDEKGNLHRIEAALEQAARHNANIACFPETAVLGWVNPEAHRRAHPLPGAWTERIGLAAREHGLMVSVGLAENDGCHLYDSAVLLDSAGNLILKHRKINTLVHLLDPPYSRGEIEDVQIAETEFGRIGMLICADTFIADILDRMAELKPDLLLVPYGWAAETHKWPEHGKKLAEVVSSAARTVGCPVAGTDCVGMIAHGPWTGHTFGGQSVVCNRSGDVLAVAADRDPDVVIVDI